MIMEEHLYNQFTVHICTDEETDLISKIIILENKLTELRGKLLELVKDRDYIYNEDYRVKYMPETIYTKINKELLKSSYPEAYKECFECDYPRKEYIRITKNK